MSYESVVIDNSVDAFWRLDGLSDTHPVLTDASGNGHHADCYAEKATNPEGHVHGGVPSPIETDAGSRAMYGRAGKVLATGFDRRNTFCWQGWIFNDTSTTDPNTLICRSGHWSLTTSNILGIGGGATNAAARLRVGTTNYELIGATALQPMTWYYLALVYNAGVIRLYVNAVVDDEETGVTGDMDVGSSTRFYLGAMEADEGAWNSRGMDEPAVGIALTQAQLLENHEAALNLLSLRGYSNIVPSAILYSAIEPDPIEFPFRHNWVEPLIERISFRTNTSRARVGASENARVRLKPRREIEITQVMRDDGERRKLRAQLWAGQSRKWFVPMLEDREQLTSPLVSGVVIVPVSTVYKDYEVGSYIGLRQLNDAGVVVHSETLQIEAMTATTVTPVTEPVNDYAAYLSSVYPVRRALISPSNIRGHTDSVEDVTIIARLLAEDEAAVPNRIIPWLPSLKYRDVEVFDPSIWQSHDWSELREYQSTMELDDVDFDAGVFAVESDAPGASETFNYSITLKGREDIAAFLGWFYERAGALNYVWVASMQRDFEVVSVAGANITVEGTNYSDHYTLAQARRDVAFVYHDNTLEFRRVTASAGAPNETLTLDATVPTLTNLRSLSLLKFCQLDADSLEIAKVTDDVWRFAWRFRELLTSPEGTGVSSLSPSVSISASPSPSASGSPSVSVSPSRSPSASGSPSASTSPSGSISPSHSASASVSPSASLSPSASASPSL